MREYIAAELPDVIDKLVTEVKQGPADDMLKSAKILLDKAMPDACEGYSPVAAFEA